METRTHTTAPSYSRHIRTRTLSSSCNPRNPPPKHTKHTDMSTVDPLTSRTCDASRYFFDVHTVIGVVQLRIPGSRPRESSDGCGSRLLPRLPSVRLAVCTIVITYYIHNVLFTGFLVAVRKSKSLSAGSTVHSSPLVSDMVTFSIAWSFISFCSLGGLLFPLCEPTFVAIRTT